MLLKAFNFRHYHWMIPTDSTIGIVIHRHRPPVESGGCPMEVRVCSEVHPSTGAPCEGAVASPHDGSIRHGYKIETVYLHGTCVILSQIASTISICSQMSRNYCHSISNKMQKISTAKRHCQFLLGQLPSNIVTSSMAIVPLLLEEPLTASRTTYKKKKKKCLSNDKAVYSNCRLQYYS